MDSQQFNRVEHEAGQWRSREERLAKIFSSALASKPLLAEKLRYFDRIAAKYAETRDQDEKFALRVLKQERRAIERKLYPNIWLRMIRRMLVVPLRSNISSRSQARISVQNSEELLAQLEGAGFTGLSDKLNEAMGKGHPEFSIPHSYYVEPSKRMDFDLTFAKDGQGNTRLQGYKAHFYNEVKPEESRGQYFSADSGKCLDTKSSLNLLQGRALEQDGGWIQLDFNDRDAMGQYRMKEFPAAYGFDIEQQVRNLPIKELHDQGEASGLVAALRAGSCQAVTFIRDGNERRCFIEANPQFRCVNIYDGHFRKITLATAMGNRAVELLAHRSIQQEEEKIEKRTRMRIS
ncbi:hypothetical protein [Sphingobacterium siyangense]|uniref:hypothetical protein n=1 Tax=Sphingobacterium siyangense TaxID=459529 RepID=UPI001962741E|nr:hypothetical protein [Sphingobacterium siyangense]QRY55588.1 hypothetical protein JVX97_16250 [Sphingobacterium siyangense]